jgi:hypothetical protein
MNKLLLTFLIIVLISLLGLFFLDRVITFSINHFSAFEISYDKLKGNILRKTEIDGLYAETGPDGINVLAKKAVFSLRIKKSFEKKKIMLDCALYGVKFIPTGKGEKDAGQEENVLAVPFSSQQEYEKITFTTYLNGKALEISDFKAVSPNIRMEGGCVFSKNTDNIALNWKISFSPEASKSLPEDVRSGVLSKDEDGWYSTVISYKGNILMLKALYSLTA